MAIIRRKASQPKEVTRDLVQRWESMLPDLKVLNDETLTMERGQHITKARCLEICGGDEKRFSKVAAKWKMTVLWLRGITIKYEPNVRGYRFINVPEHLFERTERVMIAAERKHREEALRLALIRDADMGDSDHQRKMRVLLMQQHNDTAGRIEAQREHAKIALSQPEVLPSIVRGNGSGK